jgi:hypothetical protein
MQTGVIVKKTIFNLKDLNLGLGGKMKKLLYIIAFFAVFNNLFSETKIDSLKMLSLKIIDKPEKILNLPYYFPNYFSTKYNSELFQDTTYLKNLIQFINRNFHDIKYQFTFRDLLLSDHELLPLKEGINLYNFDSTNYHSYVIVNGEYGIKFSFVNDSSKYFLIHISPYPELIYQINEKFKIILKEPERLLNIQKYFQEFFNLNYIDKRMLDTARMSEMIELINDCHNCKSEDPIITYDHTYLNELFLNSNTGSEIAYSYFIDNLNINFLFVKNINKIYLNFISVRKY